MSQTSRNKVQIVSTIVQLIQLMKRIGISRTYLFLSIFLGFCAVLFHACEIGLVIPLLKGIIGRDFGFLERFPGFDVVIGMKPELFEMMYTRFMLLVVVIFVVAIIHNIFKYLSVVCIHNQIRVANSNMRKIIFARYLIFGKLFFDRTNIGHLNSMLKGYSGSVANLLKAVEKLLSNLFSLIAYVAILLFISWQLTLVTVIVFPIMNYFSSLLGKRLKKMAMQQVLIHKDVDRKLFNILSSIPLVQAYVKEEDEKNNFAKISDREVDMGFRMSRLSHLITPIQNICALVALLFLASMLHLVLPMDGAASASSYLVFFFVVRRMVPGFNALNRFSLDMAKASGSLSLTYYVLEDDSDKHILPPGTRQFEGLKKGIEFRNLNFAYTEEVPVLKNANLTIEKGKMTAIVGPTGTGKTSIINLILRFYDCPPNTIFVDGVDIREFTLGSLRQHMALVTQDTFLFNDTLRSNMIYGMNGSHNGLSADERLMEATRQSRLGEFIGKLPDGYETIVGDRGIKLSGGEKQRVSIARALLKGSEILILDEATSALDTRTEQLIQAAIDEAVKGRTAIIIAHRLSTIKHADKIIVVEKGTVVEQGTLEELLERRSAFYQYWEAQKFF